MATRDSLDRSSSEVGGIAPIVSHVDGEPQNVMNDYPAQQPPSAVDESSSAYETVLKSDVCTIYKSHATTADIGHRLALVPSSRA